MTTTPRIYIADLAAYNAGTLHGAWIDATQDVDDILKDVHTMLNASPEPSSEEFALHDYEGFEGVNLSEYTPIEQLHEIACFISAHGKLGAKVFDHVGQDLEEAKTALNDHYAGEFTTLAHYAQELTEDRGDIPSHLEQYIDYEAMARDMEFSGDVFTIETAHDEVHVFWSR